MKSASKFPTDEEMENMPAKQRETFMRFKKLYLHTGDKLEQALRSRAANAMDRM